MFSNKQLKNLILPLVIEQVLVMAVGMADTMMISFAGEAAISGVALVDMVNNLVITILAALATGGAVIVSQYLGSKDPDNANRSASQLLTISFVLSTALAGVCLLLHRGILSLLFGSVEADVMNAAVTYFVISAFSFPFLGVYNSSAAVFRSMSKTNVTMYVSLAMNAVNLMGNSIGIFVLHAGVAGVAVPTLIARAFAAVLLVCLSTGKAGPVRVKIRDALTFSRGLSRKILSVAVPNGIENGLFQFGRVLVTSIVALFGTSQIAANGVANSVDTIAIIVVNAVNLAIVTVVGRCVGAGNYDEAKYYTKKLMKLSYIATGILGLMVILLLPFILKLYSINEETAGYAYTLIIMHNILAFLLHPTSFVLSNSIRASGDVKFTMVVGIGSMIIFRLGSALLFGVLLNLGIIGVWIAMGMDWTARSVCFVLRYKSGKWKNYRRV